MDSDIEDNDGRPLRRLQEPLGRLDDQRAGFTVQPPPAESSSTLLYGQPIYPERPIRPAPKSAGSASLPPKPPLLRHVNSWDRDNHTLPRTSPYGFPEARPRRRSRPPALSMNATPFADPGYEIPLSTPETPDTPYSDRRGSAVSTSSGGSLPHIFARAPSSTSASLKRHSVSSFGAYTINTIGDLSLSSSAPLLDRNGSRRRGSADSSYDTTWPFARSSTGPRSTTPLATPSPAYFADFSFTKRSTSPARSLPRLQSNPLGPLRKRLVRSLAASGGSRRLHTEVQLLLELVEALDACVLAYSAVPPMSSPPRDSTRLPSRPSLPLLPEGIPQNPTPSHQPNTNGMHRRMAVEEVRLLVRELFDLVPDTQRYLRAGQYGPLSDLQVTTEALLASLDMTDPVEVDPADIADPPTSTGSLAGTPTAGWWPARLARDCRSLLEEAGLPSMADGANAAAWLSAATERVPVVNSAHVSRREARPERGTS